MTSRPLSRSGRRDCAPGIKEAAGPDDIEALRTEGGANRSLTALKSCFTPSVQV